MEDKKENEKVEKVETKEVAYNIYLRLKAEKSASKQAKATLVVSGVPADLPKEYEHTTEIAVRRQFSELINTRNYIELVDDSSGTSCPFLVNLRKILYINIYKIEKAA